MRVTRKQYKFLIDMCLKFKDKELMKSLKKGLIKGEEASILIEGYLKELSKSHNRERRYHKIVKPVKKIMIVKTIRQGETIATDYRSVKWIKESKRKKVY